MNKLHMSLLIMLLCLMPVPADVAAEEYPAADGDYTSNGDGGRNGGADRNGGDGRNGGEARNGDDGRNGGADGNGESRPNGDVDDPVYVPDPEPDDPFNLDLFDFGPLPESDIVTV